MSRISIRAPLIAGGISQQAAPNRFPGQVEAAANADFTVQDGITKRRGTTFHARPTGLTASGVYRMEPIVRDDTERYLAVIGPDGSDMKVRVYDTAGVAQTVDIKPAAQTYLNSGLPTADDIRVRSSGDYTIIVNTKATPAAASASNYTITRTANNYSQMLSAFAASGTYHRALAADELGEAGYYQYTIGNGGGQFAYSYGGAVSQATMLSYCNTYSPHSVSLQSELSVSIINGVWNNTARTITLTNAFAGYVFKAGDEIQFTGGTGVNTSTWHVITAKNSDSQITVATDINGATGDISNVSGATIRRVTTVQTNLGQSATYEEALAKMNKAIRDSGSDLFGVWSTSLNRTIWVSEFKTTSATRVRDRGLHPSGAYQFDLWSMWAATTGTYLDVAGTTARSTTVLASGPSVLSRWARTSPPASVSSSLTATTMPIAMRRVSASTFDVDVISWTPRYTGDQFTNPAPRAVTEGKPIADVAFWNDRLVLLAGQYIHMSQDGDYFNFYADDATNITDADPISRTLSTDQVAIGDRLIPIREALLVFTKAGRQFEVTTVDSAPTPTSVIVTASTNYPAIAIAPAAMHNYIYFATTAGNFASIREYGYQPEGAALSAPSITEHVPQLIPAALRRIVTHPQSSTIVALPSTGTTMYVHRSFWSGPRREQSSWTTYTFDASYRFCDLAVIGDRCYALVESQSQYVIESWPLLEPAPPSGHAYAPVIDRRMTVTGGSFSAGNTTWTLPSSLSDTTLNRVVSTAGVEYVASCSGTTLTVAGANLSSGSYQAGRSYDMSVELTEFYLRDDQGRADLEMGVGVKTVYSHHRNTYAYSLRVDHNESGRPDHTTALNSTTVDQRGELRLPVFNRANSCRVLIESSSSAPCAISSIEADVQPIVNLR